MGINKKSYSQVLFLAIIISAISQVSCKKESDSPDSIEYTINGGPKRSCSGRALANEALGPYCDLKVGRDGHYMYGLSASVSLEVDTDCNVINGPLPYTTTNFIFGIVDNKDVPQTTLDLSYYSYDKGHTYDFGIYPTPPYDSTANHNPDHVVLVISYRKNGRIKGTVKGEIYSVDVHDLKPRTVDCSFDILVPFR